MVLWWTDVCLIWTDLCLTWTIVGPQMDRPVSVTVHPYYHCKFAIRSSTTKVLQTYVSYKYLSVYGSVNLQQTGTSVVFINSLMVKMVQNYYIQKYQRLRLNQLARLNLVLSNHNGQKCKHYKIETS